MIIKTKKVVLTPEDYFQISIKGRLVKDWWVCSLILLFLPLSIFLSKYWIIILYIICIILYFGFWAIQFWGVRYLDQMQVIFAPVYYEISQSNIFAKLSATTGYNIDWKMIKDFKVTKKEFILNLSLAQFVYIPFKSFNSLGEQNIFYKILQNKLKRKFSLFDKLIELYARVRTK